MKLADAILKEILVNECSMDKEAMFAFADEQTDDWALNQNVAYMLEEDELIVYTGIMVGWRVQLTNKGCKAAKMGLNKYLKRLAIVEKLTVCEKFSTFASATVGVISMIITIIFTIITARLAR